MSGGKVMTAAEAVRRFVRPGMTVQAGAGLAFPVALLHEVTRQFWGRDPGFTFVMASGGCINLVPLLRGGLLRRFISSFNGDGYPYPAPNPAVQRAYREGRVDFEEWTMLTLTLRLAAGAMGLPFLPTRSLLGSSLEEENARRGDLCRLPDPFGGEADIGLVRALAPDLSLVHGWAADAEGNTAITPPLAGNAYGALAARQGVLVSVEQVVEREIIRRHSHLVKIPASRVLAVAELPFGAHPGGHNHLGMAPTGGYAEDRDFVLEARRASADDAVLDAWLGRWILEPRDHGEYLERLGPDRLVALRERLTTPAAGPAPGGGPTPRERMIVAAARVVARTVREGRHDAVLAGIGAAHLACWLARETLASGGTPLELLAEVGMVAYQPLPGDPFVFAQRNVPTAALNTDILTTLGILVAGQPSRTLGVIGAAQVDRHGNVNTTRIPALNYQLVGSGGANDVASSAGEVIVVAEQDRLRWPERVPYVTSPGARVSAVISQLGVYRRVEGELRLAGCFRGEDTARDAIGRCREECGWELGLAPGLEELEEPTPAELALLRAFDPPGDYR